MNAVSIRGDWVGQIIDGRFSLLEWLGGSGTSGTFLTELAGAGSQKAAIKLFSAPAQAEDRLATWEATTSLSHVHLVRILHFGRAEIDGVRLVYVVTELAEEMLSQIIPERPLAPEEAGEMLEPILDALSYLHANGYVHGHVKPSNILVVENEVKLSADGVLAEDKPSRELLGNDVHNAPETTTEPVAPAIDIWSLGVTLVEALTQQLPVWDVASDTEPVLPASLPEPFAGIARECLHIDPAQRCTLSDIRVMLDGKATHVSPPPAPMETHPTPEIAGRTSRSRLPVVPLVIGLALLVAIIIGFGMHSHKTNTASQQAEATQQAPPAEPESQAPATSPSTSAPVNASPADRGAVKGEVLDRVVPDVPRKASDTIQGRISVVVRVAVDSAGMVTNAEFDSHGSSAYFARLAIESARNWKFKPPQQGGHAVASTWLLHYEFKRGGVQVDPVEKTP